MQRLALIAAAALLTAGCTAEFSLTLGADPSLAAEAGLVPSTSTTAPPATTSTTTTTTVPPQPITLGFVGDVHMVGSMPERDPLGAVTRMLSRPDLTFANLETVVGTVAEVGPPPIAKQFLFRSPPESLELLAAAGIDVVGMANNHAWDHGGRGAAATRAHVDASPLVGAGVGPDPATAYAPAYLEVGGRVVGIVSVTRVPCDWSTDQAAERPEVAWACDRFAVPTAWTIATAVDGSDVTVVLLHGGTEMTDCPDDRLREVIDVWVSLGVDVVAISHPHVLQGVEIVDGAAVLWSTGNFAFGNRGGRTGRSAIFEVTFGDRVEQIRLRPTVLPGGVAAPATVQEAALVRQEVSDRSVGGRLDEAGVLVADPAPSICD